MANIKDFAAGIVVTPPSPATTGTSMTLRVGDGGTFPAVPFYVTVTPPGNLTTLGTSEKLLVTAVSGDTFTITRAQSPTTAKSIAAGWIVANAIYTADVTSSSIVMDEVLTGTVNGSNTVFTTASAFSNILIFKNGVTLHVGSGNDYTITGSNQITFTSAPATGSVLTATYIMGSTVMINGSSSLITDEVPTGSVNGSNTSFTVSKGVYVGGSLEVFINGIKQARGTHFTESTPGSGIFTMGDAPLTGDNIIVNYQFATSTSANADTVDGFNASSTPTANTIPVLDSNGKMPDGTATPGNFLQLKMSGTTTVTTTAANIAFNTVDVTSGTKLTQSGNTVVIGSGVSVVRVSYNLMSDSGGSASYLFSRIRKNGTDVSQAIDGAANQFRATSETRVVSVTAGDVISVAADSGSNTLLVGRNSVLLVEVIA